MAVVINITDIVVNVVNTDQPLPILGSLSDFADVEHPGTNQTVHGWEWDVRFWPGEETELSSVYSPSLFDPGTTAIPDSFFQSGTGGRDDLEVNSLEAQPASGLLLWAPEVKHGYFYIGPKEHYLFADSYRSQVAEFANTYSGLSLVELDENPKVGVPVHARTWLWDSDDYRYRVETNYRKVVDFTGLLVGEERLETRDSITDEILFDNIDPDKREFVVEEIEDTLSVLFNGQYVEEIGEEITNSGQLVELEQVGEVESQDNQIHHLLYSPLDSTQSVDIYTYPSVSGTTWTTWEVVEEFTSSGQVLVDYDLGIIQFGTSEEGNRPEAGEFVGAHYWRSVGLEYEPENTPNVLLATKDPANSNPINRMTNRGFIILSDQPSDPVSITLWAELPVLAIDVYGPVDIGSQYVILRARVRSRTGEVLEGQTVTFAINSTPAAGSLSGGGTSATAVTGADGIATVFYSPPRNINDIGEITDVITAGPPGEIVTSEIVISPDTSRSWIYKVFTDDDVMGIPLDTETDWVNYWTDFFTEDPTFSGWIERIEGRTGLDDPELLTGNIDQIWEARHRLLLGLLTPQEYNRDLRNGRKQIVAVWNDAAIHPRTGELGAFAPLQASGITYSGSNTTLTFSGVTLDLPGGDLDGYFVVSDPSTDFVATTYNSQIGRNIESNEITINMQVPDSLNGTYLIEDINDVPVGLVSWALNSTIHEGRRLPLGLRLRTSGITIASALNGVTYLDINRPASQGFGFRVQLEGTD